MNPKAGAVPLYSLRISDDRSQVPGTPLGNTYVRAWPWTNFISSWKHPLALLSSKMSVFGTTSSMKSPRRKGVPRWPSQFIKDYASVMTLVYIIELFYWEINSWFFSGCIWRPGWAWTGWRCLNAVINDSFFFVVTWYMDVDSRLPDSSPLIANSSHESVASADVVEWLGIFSM